jgi:hypothetical protein
MAYLIHTHIEAVCASSPQLAWANECDVALWDKASPRRMRRSRRARSSVSAARAASPVVGGERVEGCGVEENMIWARKWQLQWISDVRAVIL